MPAALERIFRGYVARGSGLASRLVIPGNDRAPSPVDSYATLLLINDSRAGFPISEQLAGGQTRKLQHRLWEGSLQFYRKAAPDYALAFCDYAESENGLTDAEETRIRVVTPLKFQNISDIVADGYEERALVNLGIHYLHVTTQDTGQITQIEGTLFYDPLTEDVN